MAQRKRAIVRPLFSFPYTVVVPVASHRKCPDPVLPGVEHHFGYIPALLYPADGFPNDPNLRPPNIDRQIYKQIAESLLNQDCMPNTYHLKSKGEFQVAAQVRELGQTETKEWFEVNLRPLVKNDNVFDDFHKKYKLLEVTYEEPHGIADGGHTDRIWSDPDYQKAIRESYQEDGENGTEPKPNRNHLPIEWLTGIPADLVPEVVGGRNTALQVQEKTLANHEGKFQWIKDLLASEHYANLIAYRENEPRAEKPVDIRELLGLVAPFNRELYSLTGEAGKRIPVSAFSQKQAVLDLYVEDQEDREENGRGRKTYQKVRGILRDILELHDLIHLEGVRLYNESKSGKGKGGRFTFVDYRDPAKRQKPHQFVFTGKAGQYRLADGALYPILAAFSALVTVGPDGNFEWNTPDGFEGVKKLWREFAPKFIELTQNKSEEVGRNPAQIGKSTNHWELLYLQVAMKVATTSR